MALGYVIGSILKRNSISYSDDKITVKIDDIEGMGGKFIQVISFEAWLPITLPHSGSPGLCSLGCVDHDAVGFIAFLCPDRYR